MADNQEELEKIQEKIRKLKESKFKQQMLPAWRPVPSFGSTMIIFGIFGVIFLALGVTLYIMSNKIQSVSIQYDDKCPETIKWIEPDDPNPSNPCTILEEIDGIDDTPIYVYYQLNNFYQNHRRYVKSRSNAQLLGENLTADQLQDDCAPIVLNKDTGRYQSIGGTELDPEAPAYPCGLVAKSLFNDTFELYSGKDVTDENRIEIDQNDIAWASDKENKFFNLPSP